MSGTVHPGMPDAEYFALDALSHSDTKTLEHSPAKFRYLRDHPREATEPTDDMRFGSAVHSLVLGGPAVVHIEADNYQTKAAREQRDEAEDAGNIPLKTKDYMRAVECAHAVRNHPVAAKLLDNAEHRELVCVWDDNGVELRAKIDAVCGRFGVDLKTTQNASTDAFARSIGTYNYWSQDAWYREAMRQCLGISDPAFVFIAVEKDPPYLVNVVQLEDYAVDLGHKRNERLIAVYRECVAADAWPAFGDGINQVTLPRWVEMQEEMQ